MYRLNQFIAKSGICSRRAAEELILSGKISVNGKVIYSLGTKVSTQDLVKYENKILPFFMISSCILLDMSVF